MDVNQETTQLLVPSISCAHCERSVVEALSPLVGVRSVSVDIPTKLVLVDFDPGKVSIERISTVLAEEDHPVAEVSPVATRTPLPMASAGGCACCSPSA